MRVARGPVILEPRQEFLHTSTADAFSGGLSSPERRVCEESRVNRQPAPTDVHADDGPPYLLGRSVLWKDLTNMPLKDVHPLNETRETNDVVITLAGVVLPAVNVQKDQRMFPIVSFDAIEQCEQSLHLFAIGEPSLVVEFDDTQIVRALPNSPFGLIVIVLIVPMLNCVFGRIGRPRCLARDAGCPEGRQSRVCLRSYASDEALLDLE